MTNADTLRHDSTDTNQSGAKSSRQLKQLLNKALEQAVGPDGDENQKRASVNKRFERSGQKTKA